VFIEEAERLQTLLTDDAIDKALHQWPEDIYDLDAPDISEKIKSRRNNLLDYAKGFKTILDEKPLLTSPLKGSEALELPQDLMACFGCKSHKER